MTPREFGVTLSRASLERLSRERYLPRELSPLKLVSVSYDEEVGSLAIVFSEARRDGTPVEMPDCETSWRVERARFAGPIWLTAVSTSGDFDWTDSMNTSYKGTYIDASRLAKNVGISTGRKAWVSEVPHTEHGKLLLYPDVVLWGKNEGLG